MDKVVVYCPNCNAKTKIAFDATSYHCDYCDCTITRELSDSDKAAIQKEKEINAIRLALSKRMQLNILDQKLHELQDRQNCLCMEEYKMPVFQIDDAIKKKRAVIQVSPFFLGFFTFVFLIEALVLWFLLFLALTAGSVWAFRSVTAQINAENADRNAKLAEAELEKQLFISDHEREFSEIKEKILTISAQIESITPESRVSFLSNEYQEEDTLRFLLDALSDDSTKTLHDAIHKYKLSKKPKAELSKPATQVQQPIPIPQNQQSAPNLVVIQNGENQAVSITVNETKVNDSFVKSQESRLGGTQEERIVQIVDKYIHKIPAGSWKAYDSKEVTVNQNLIENAKYKYGFIADGRIIGMIDTTIFGSGKDGILITTTGIAMKYIFTPAFIRYSEIKAVEYKSNKSELQIIGVFAGVKDSQSKKDVFPSFGRTFYELPMLKEMLDEILSLYS